MMNPRLRRLDAEWTRIKQVFSRSPYIQLVSTEGTPPERYVFEFSVDGLVSNESDELCTSIAHKAQIYLPLDYPRCAPFCRMLTEVFHPNIDPQKICIGDHWSAGQTLDSLVVRIAEMICFQSYNTKSPLNAKAAAWAEQNPGKLPLLKADLSGSEK
jgi:ubiquitin-protein ligase